MFGLLHQLLKEEKFYSVSLSVFPFIIWSFVFFTPHNYTLNWSIQGFPVHKIEAINESKSVDLSKNLIVTSLGNV